MTLPIGPCFNNRMLELNDHDENFEKLTPDPDGFKPIPPLDSISYLVSRMGKQVLSPSKTDNPQCPEPPIKKKRAVPIVNNTRLNGTFKGPSKRQKRVDFALSQPQSFVEERGFSPKKQTVSSKNSKFIDDIPNEQPRFIRQLGMTNNEPPKTSLEKQVFALTDIFSKTNLKSTVTNS